MLAARQWSGIRVRLFSMRVYVRLLSAVGRCREVSCQRRRNILFSRYCASIVSERFHVVHFESHVFYTGDLRKILNIVGETYRAPFGFRIIFGFRRLWMVILQLELKKYTYIFSG